MLLKFRISGIVTLLMFIVVAGISTTILLRARGLQTDAAMENAHNIAGEASENIARRFEVYIDAARTVAQIMDSTEVFDRDELRRNYNGILQSVLESNPNFVAIASVWQPNALDGLDAQYANTPGTDSSGRYMSWYTKENATGTIEYKAYTDYQSILNRLNGELIIDPVFRTIQGKQVLVTDVWSPIEKDGRIIGGVGITVNIEPLQQTIEALKPYGTGVSAIFSSNGTVVAHFDGTRNGKNMRETERDLNGEHNDSVADSIRDGVEVSYSVYSEQMGTDLRIIAVPFIVGNTTTPWALMVGIPMDQVNAPVRAITQFTMIVGVVSILVLMFVIYLIINGTMKPIVNMSVMLKDIAEGEGDLTKTLDIHSKDEIGEMAGYFNQTLGKIRDLIVVIKNQSVTLFDIGTELSSNMTETAAAINEITANIQGIKGQVVNQSASVTETNSTMEQVVANIDKLNNHVESQAASVAQSSSAIEEMLANISSVTQTLVKNMDNVKELSEASEVGRSGLQEVSSDIQEISRESEGLLEINAVMENIASQTNLLSMNAAIEAAHAGEAGKGFAVVADEIRKLAESSGEQSKTISVVLKKIKESIDKIQKSTDTVLTRFEAIDGGVRTVAEQEENIRNAMEEQGQGSKQILEAIGQLNEITQMVKSGSEEMLQGSKEVIHESENLGRVTQEITNGMNEMATGADQINTAVNRVNEISGENKEHIDTLVREVSRFKVE
ncbi:methyl-accepting chemotaxis protein [Breznakiella homolactica]|uniref:Methyl-accepting chemotaxis protein n=1 Tax=Breznakiella homolactica TaxID=2798577 RepID=A0A7T7XP32_9SPIR|nr:methyl-accepting chemotaxis protein [Breznakiella homolactica]QQO09886.1 methyl-accepting chemotaxis protein [Breznakiella homolactica]